MLLLVFDFIDKNIKVQIHPDDVKDIINDLKNIFNAREIATKIQLLYNGFDDLRDEVLSRWKFIIKRDSERIVDSDEKKFYIDAETRYLENKLDFLQRKYQLWKDECPSVNEILRKIKEFISAEHDSVKLSTIHRAKGLENDRIFILNYDELPYYRLGQKEWEGIQELNLKYVAVTRVKNDLFLVASKSQNAVEEDMPDPIPVKI